MLWWMGTVMMSHAQSGSLHPECMLPLNDAPNLVSTWRTAKCNSADFNFTDTLLIPPHHCHHLPPITTTITPRGNSGETPTKWLNGNLWSSYFCLSVLSFSLFPSLFLSLYEIHKRLGGAASSPQPTPLCHGLRKWNALCATGFENGFYSFHFPTPIRWRFDPWKQCVSINVIVVKF